MRRMRGGGALARAHAVRRMRCRAATRPTPAAPRCATRSAAFESARRAATRVNSRAPQKLALVGWNRWTGCLLAGWSVDG